MRETLFRGKRVDNGEWVESGNINTQTDMYGKEHTYIGLYETSNFAPLQRTIYWVEVDPETVGQFTGLTDKNCKKVFEGDIVRQQTFHKLPLKYKDDKEKNNHKKYLIKKCGAIFDDEERYHNNYIWVVRFENARFYPFADDCFEWGRFNWNIPFEVIGNIHENHELLEKK